MKKYDNNLQNKFHGRLTNYINCCALSKLERIISILSLRISSLGHAATLTKEYNKISPTNTSTTEPQEINILPYSHENTYVLAMMKKLAASKNDLIGAYIHGSLATNENILYSDFDALIIIKDEVFESPTRLASLAVRLASLRKIMFQYDPLQHHGWFVLTEKDLKNYCDAYFPVTLFEYSKSLFPDQGTNLKIHIRESSIESNLYFLELCDSLINRFKSGYRPKNMHQMKSILSQFMLLPALYLQAKKNKGIYKKLSFELAKTDFSTDEWGAMIEASKIREIWSYKLNKINRYLLTHPIGLRRIITRYFSPQATSQIKSKMDDKFYTSVVTLIISMKNRVSDK